jgi:hypothetical protein
MTLSNQLSPLLDAGYLEEAIRRHFEPLLDPAFDDLLRRRYPATIRFEVDGRALARADGPRGQRVRLAIRLGRRRTPAAVGFIERLQPAAPDREGIAISALGKIIKRGWDWLGLAPVAHTPVSGLIEAPELAAGLTLSKNDFIRSGARGASYLAYRKAIQEIVSRQLAAWGDERHSEVRPGMARLERDLERVLEDLAEDFPLLRSLVDRRTGGQKRLPMPGRGHERVPMPLFTSPVVGHESLGRPDISRTADIDTAEHPPAPPPTTVQPPAPTPSVVSPEGGHQLPEPEATPVEERPAQEHLIAAADTRQTVAGRRRPARYGLLVQFESRPDNPELGRLVDSTIWINDAHPAYTRAAASRSLGYHTALVVAFTLAPLAVDARGEHAFILQFLMQWGSSPTRRDTRGRRVKPTG